jgi:putative oxidoreductase
MDSSTPLFLPQMAQIYQIAAPLTETLTRAILGLALIPHGLRFCFGLFPNTGSRVLSIDILVSGLERSGYRPGRFWAYAIAATEFVGGPLLALGLFTRPVAAVIFVFLLNAVIEHARFDGYFWNKLGLEYPMIWCAGLLFFVVNGAGPYSLDHWLIGRAF